MLALALVASTVIGLGYFAIFLQILRKVLLPADAWRTNRLAAATASIFLSCGIGHALHAVHIVELGPEAAGMYDSHIALWDTATAGVAVWYWTLRGRFDALRGSGALFQDAVSAEQARLVGLLEDLFDGVVAVPAGAGPQDLPEVVHDGDPERAAVAARLCAEALLPGAGVVAGTLDAGLGGRTVELRAVALDERSVLLSWRDLSELVRAREDVALLSQELAAAFDAAPVGMAVLAEGRVEQQNAALTRLVRREAVQRFADLFDEEDRGEAEERLAAVHHGGPLGSWEARVLVSSGATRWVEVSLAPVAGPVGQAPLLVAHLVDVQERKLYETRLRHLADHDPLTGLANRRRFEEELGRACARAQRGSGSAALLLLDLDHFKEVNDTLGHAVGDQLIVSVADALRGVVRAGDVVARLGGDEFAVLAAGAAPEEAEALAERVVRAVRERARGFGDPGTATRRVTCSVGVTDLLDDAPQPALALMAADLTLYDAKEAGRDRWARYRDDDHGQPRTKSRLEWLERLRRALDEDGLVPLAQPVVDLSTGLTSHVELLLRLRDEQGELVPPSRFLYLAEQSDLVHDVDLHMLRLGVEHATRTGTGVCVNVSGRSLSDPVTLQRMHALVRGSGLPPEQLVLEVTETAAVSSIAQAKEALRSLREAGCRIALDDFGAGFGSLAYVKHLPFDVLKIDGQFVVGCRTDRTDLTVVDAVVSLARGLGKLVVAEHVPDRETAELLRRHGVHYGQGFALGRPEPLAVVPAPRTAVLEAPAQLPRPV